MNQWYYCLHCLTNDNECCYGKNKPVTKLISNACIDSGYLSNADSNTIGSLEFL